MENIEQLKIWLNELLYRTNDIEDHFQIIPTKGQEEGYQIHFYTKDNKYVLIIAPSFNRDGTTYFGCLVSNRKPRAGEDWDRGNDLGDGKFNKKTWNKIKNDIISYELVKIIKQERESFDTETIASQNIDFPDDDISEPIIASDDDIFVKKNE